MIEKTKTKNILNKKHLLIIGKSEIERRNFINDLILGLNFEVFRFPSNMKLFDEYYDFVKKEKLYEPWYNAKSYNGNQILDFHWNWISENNALIVMEEFEQMEESWRIELLRIYLNEIGNRKKGEKKIHLIISQESENGLTEKLAQVIDIRENERRTKKQIVQQNLEIINI
jgi:hypothetical protein